MKKEKKPKAERCRVCKKKVTIQINRGTGLCSQVCAKTEKKEGK